MSRRPPRLQRTHRVLKVCKSGHVATTLAAYTMPSVELKEPAAAKTTTDAQDGRTVTAVAQEEPADAKSVTIAQLIGAVLFAVGSAFFVWMAWADDWVLPWRVGCALWIVGCVPYLWPPLRQEPRDGGDDEGEPEACGEMTVEPDEAVERKDAKKKPHPPVGHGFKKRDWEMDSFAWYCPKCKKPTNRDDLCLQHGKVIPNKVQGSTVVLKDPCRALDVTIW